MQTGIHAKPIPTTSLPHRLSNQQDSQLPGHIDILFLGHAVHDMFSQQHNMCVPNMCVPTWLARCAQLPRPLSE